MFINFEFEIKFGQYCDSDQMSNLRHLIDNKFYLDVSYNDKEPYVIDESVFDEDLMSSEELISKNCFLEDFAQCIFGQVIIYRC